MMYIGSTTSFELRKFFHLKDLTDKKHCNYKLQRDYNKGVEFTFTIIEVVDKENTKNLLIREQYYIDTLKPKYNINKVATSTLKGFKKPSVKKRKQRIKRLNAQAEMNILLGYK